MFQAMLDVPEWCPGSAREFRSSSNRSDLSQAHKCLESADAEYQASGCKLPRFEIRYNLHSTGFYLRKAQLVRHELLQSKCRLESSLQFFASHSSVFKESITLAQTHLQKCQKISVNFKESRFVVVMGEAINREIEAFQKLPAKMDDFPTHLCEELLDVTPESDVE